MRIYEFAKNYGLQVQDVIEFLQKNGIAVKSHMSALSDDALIKLESLVKKTVSSSNEKAPIKKVDAEKHAEKKDPDVSSAQPPKADTVSDKRKSEMQKEPQKQSPSRPSYTGKSHKDTTRPSSGAHNNNHKRSTYNSQNAVPEQKKIFTVRALTVGDFADENNLPVGDLIVTLLKQGKACTKNFLLPVDLVKSLCRHYDIEMEEKEAVASGAMEGMALRSIGVEGTRTKRLPVVVVMGHVDHGKTSLLDFVRKTRVASREKGGITQHLGAYQVHTKEGELIFLDTPGHEAFSKIRKRGISVADLVVLVVAADDGIMPQTVECIKIIKSLQVPAVVAINKIDKVDPARLEIIKRQLAQYDMVPEEWGGNVVCVPISAKTGQGIDNLLEMLVFSAEMLELDAAQNTPAQGYVLEAKMAQGKGVVATVICHAGTLSLGDYFKVEESVSKVVSLTDSYGKSLKSVGASVPVALTGFTEMPSVGGILEVITEAEYKKLRFTKEQKPQVGSTSTAKKENKYTLIVKADTYSSLEAILDGFQKQFGSAVFKDIMIVRSGVGDITESDALLAQDTGAMIIGFSVKVENNASSFIKKEKIKYEIFDIIYKLFEKVGESLTIQKAVVKELRKIGEALVLKTFDVKKLGVIAGCVVKEGRFNDKGTITVLRQKKEIFSGKLKSLQRDKKTVKEVHTGFECAFIADGFNEWEEDDVVYCYLEVIV